MKTEELQKLFKRHHSQWEKTEKAIFGVQETYDLTCVGAGCRFCDIGKADKKLPFEESRKNCRTDSKCRKVLSAYEKLLQMRRKESEIFESYAYDIWCLLNREKPLLIRDVTGETVPWEEAFGTEYAALSEPLKNSLVAIVELDGGQYRLAE